MELSFLYNIPRTDFLDTLFLFFTNLPGSFGQLWIIVGIAFNTHRIRIRYSNGNLHELQEGRCCSICCRDTRCIQQTLSFPAFPDGCSMRGRSGNHSRFRCGQDV